MASPLLLLLRVWLYRRRTQPLPTTGVSCQATQDIFSFCFPHGPFFSTSLTPASPPRGTPVRGVLRFPYGDSSTFEVSVLGDICGLQGLSQVWGFPSPYDQYWGTPWEPRFFEAPAPLLTTLEWVFPVFIEIKFHFLSVTFSQVKGSPLEAGGGKPRPGARMLSLGWGPHWCFRALNAHSVWVPDSLWVLSC